MKVNLNKQRGAGEREGEIERERERKSMLLNEKTQYYGQDVNSL